MLTRTRTRMLAAVAGEPGWAHPYASPFVLYADGGDSGDGGDGQGDDADDGADGDGTGDDDGADDSDDDGDRDGDGADEDALGDKGKKALRELRRENRRLKAQLRDRGDGGASGRQGSAKDGDQGEDDAETIRERAREEARAEVWAERVEAAAVAAAAGRLANPSRVAQLLGEDLADIPKDDKGRPDKAAISELIDDLLETDPYLAAPATGTGRRFQGDADSGARKKTKKAAASLGEAVAARLAGKTGG